MPDAFASLDAGDLFDDTDTVAQLKDFFALHFARSLTAFDVFDASRVRSLEELTRDRDLRYRRRFDRLFEELTGIVPAGPGARLYALEEMLRRIAAKIGRGSEFFSERIAATFTRVREELDGCGLQIGVAESGSFIIGDDPVQTIDSESGRVGILSGVTLEQADVVLMPLGPRHVVSAAKEDGWLPIQPTGVRRLNRVQVLAARRKVYLVPGDGFAENNVRTLWEELRVAPPGAG